MNQEWAWARRISNFPLMCWSYVVLQSCKDKDECIHNLALFHYMDLFSCIVWFSPILSIFL